jgi:hypothetical protein
MIQEYVIFTLNIVIMSGLYLIEVMDHEDDAKEWRLLTYSFKE